MSGIAAAGVAETAVFTGDHVRRRLLDRDRLLEDGDAALILGTVWASIEPRLAS